MPLPEAIDVRKLLEGYGIDVAVLSDTWIDTCISEEIVPEIEQITRCSFSGVQTAVEYYSGTGSSILLLNKRNVVDVTSIEYVTGSYSGNLVSATEVIGSEGIIKLTSSYNEGVYGAVFRRGQKNIKVTYTYGYADYPTQVARAIKLLAAAKSLNLIQARTGGGSFGVQAHSRNYGSHGRYTDIRKEMVNSAYKLLKKYMTGVVGS